MTQGAPAERIGPHRTDAVHWPLMVEVQELELVLGARQVDFEGVCARCAVEAANATEGGHTESVNKRRLVVPVSMADKRPPTVPRRGVRACTWRGAT